MTAALMQCDGEVLSRPCPATAVKADLGVVLGDREATMSGLNVDLGGFTVLALRGERRRGARVILRRAPVRV
jgi:hypothetical protein